MSRHMNSNEELIMDLADGYYLVKLLSEEAKTATIEEMQNDALYSGNLNNQFYAMKHYDQFLLRDNLNNPRILFGVFQKNDKSCVTSILRIIVDDMEAHKKLAIILEPVFEKFNWPYVILQEIRNQLNDKNGIWYDLDKLPAGFVYNGDLNLGLLNSQKVILPINTKIKGNLEIFSSNVELPFCLTVDGDINYRDGKIYKNERQNIINLPHHLIAENVVLSQGNIHSFGREIDIKKTLSISHIKNSFKIPKDIKIGKSLVLFDTNIQEIPEGIIPEKDFCLEVSSQIFNKISDKILNYKSLKLSCDLQEKIPENIIVEDNLTLGQFNSNLLPSKITVNRITVIENIAGELDISGWNINERLRLVGLRKAKVKLPAKMNLSSLTLAYMEDDLDIEEITVGNSFSLFSMQANRVPKVTFLDANKKHEFGMMKLDMAELPIIDTSILNNFRGNIELSMVDNLQKISTDLGSDTNVIISCYRQFPESYELFSQITLTLQEYNDRVAAL